MSRISVIYYSANQEMPDFEAKIIDNLKLQAGDIPIVSVSRKPMDLGHNICIGEQPICYSNSWKQLLVGLRAATTEFCLAAESDVLYPPEYFQFIPPLSRQVYRYTNVWVSFHGKPGFWRKPWSEGAQLCGREYWIERLAAALDDGWEPMSTHPSIIVRQIFKDKCEYSWTGNPVITFKTRNGISYKTGFARVRETKLPYWGDAKTLYQRMFP